MLDTRPLIAHVMYRFDIGGLENGIVNLINHMPEDAYRHVVISLTEITEFKNRITRPDVQFIALNKPPGHAIWIYPQLYRVFRKLKPDVIHSRNLAALETVIPAWAAGVKNRLHGEHGRDMNDLNCKTSKYKWIRRIYSPFIKHYVALSADLADYLEQPVGISRNRITQIYNGVDAEKFLPCATKAKLAGCPFDRDNLWIIGTAGRMQTVKDQTNLAHAFVESLRLAPELRPHLRLIMVGEGPLRAQCQQILEAGNAAELAWLPGERNDIETIMRGLDCFVLPSRSEGISNTILEAMASGLPIIATAVGGNGELVQEGKTGKLVPSENPTALAQAIIEFARYPEKSRAMGKAGRQNIEAQFSMKTMVGNYQKIYDNLCQNTPVASTV